MYVLNHPIDVQYNTSRCDGWPSLVCEVIFIYHIIFYHIISYLFIFCNRFGIDLMKVLEDF